jgi:transcriptional regulator GlxA family with amidase domain
MAISASHLTLFFSISFSILLVSIGAIFLRVATTFYCLRPDWDRTGMPTIENELFINEIARLGATARYLTSVCSGSLILGAAGFLTGRRAACHWAWRELLPIFGAIADDGRKN